MNRTLTRAVLGLAAVLALAVAPALTATAASAATAWHGGGYTCTGGNIPAGTYTTVTVKGKCYMTDGLITVLQDLKVGKGALLDAGATLGDPKSGTPVVPATVDIRGNVFVGKGAVLVLGCSPNLLGICSGSATFDTIGGNLTAEGALADVLHNTDVRGNVTIQGGGGGVTCSPAPLWAEDKAIAATQTPQYTDIEDSFIGGNYTVTNVSTCWNGTLRDQIRGNTDFSGNTDADPDGMEILNNLVGGNMACSVSGKGGLLVRVGAEAHARMLPEPHVVPMEMGGRTMTAFVRISPEGYRTEAALRKWIQRGLDGVAARPAKTARGGDL